MATNSRSSAARPLSFGLEAGRLGRTESLREFAQVLQKQTTGRLSRAAASVGRQAVTSALAPLPGPLQASMYNMLTTNPFSKNADVTDEAERVRESQTGKSTQLWQKNLERLFKIPLPVTIIDRRGAKLAELEEKRENASKAEKVEPELKDEEKKKGFFGSLLSGFKNLFFNKGGLAGFLTALVGGAGALAIGGLKFAAGVGLVGLLGSILFKDKILKQFTADWDKIADEWDTTALTARVADFMSGDPEGGLANSITNAAKWGTVGALAGWLALGPPGILAGLAIGAVIGAVTGALGGKEVAKLADFATKMFNDGWDKAMLNYDTKTKKEVDARIEAQIKLKTQLESEGNYIEATKVYDEIIQLRQESARLAKEIAERAIKITQADIDQAKKRLKQSQWEGRVITMNALSAEERENVIAERKSEVMKARDALGNILPTSFKTAKFLKLDLSDSDDYMQALDMIEGLKEGDKMQSLSVLRDQPVHVTGDDAGKKRRFTHVEHAQSYVKRLYGGEQEPGWYVNYGARILLTNFIDALEKSVQGRGEAATIQNRTQQTQEAALSALMRDPNTGFRGKLRHIFGEKYANELTPASLSKILVDKVEIRELLRKIGDAKTAELVEVLQKLNIKMEAQEKEVPAETQYKGTSFKPNRPYWVGEFGPELVIPEGYADIIPTQEAIQLDKMNRGLFGMGGRGQQSPTVVSNSGNVMNAPQTEVKNSNIKIFNQWKTSPIHNLGIPNLDYAAA